MSRILITGSNGQLGTDVVAYLKSTSTNVILPVDVREMDLSKIDDIYDKLVSLKPEIIIHCAAFTAVDEAEDNSFLCMRINAEATRVIAEYAADFDVLVVYISTDYVFNGENDLPYNEDDATNPINLYGVSKLIGERHIESLLDKYFILRISWVFGIHGNNFIKTMLRLAQSRDEINVVSDQFGSPTSTKDLARLIFEMINSDNYGTYHVTNEGFCSWYEFACEIFNQFDIDIKVIPISSAEFPTRAKRPKNSRLCKNKLVENGFKLFPHWRDALADWRIDYERMD